MRSFSANSLRLSLVDGEHVGLNDCAALKTFKLYHFIRNFVKVSFFIRNFVDLSEHFGENTGKSS
jgi:hypothetical protein